MARGLLDNPREPFAQFRRPGRFPESQTCQARRRIRRPIPILLIGPPLPSPHPTNPNFLFIDNPQKESYNHINRRAGPYEGSADREKERT